MKLDVPQASDSLFANRPGLRRLFLLALVLACMASRVLAAASLNLEIMGSGYTAGGQGKTSVGETVTITLTVTNAKVSQAIQLPHVDGLIVNGSGTNPDAHSESFYFFVTPTRSGDLTIPAFDVRTDEGQTLHVNATKLHVVGP